MNEEISGERIVPQIRIHTEYAHKTCSILFSWDALFYHTFFVSLYLLIFRLFFTFMFAFIFVQQWHVEKVGGWFPIVAFNSDFETFTKMNSYAVVVTGIAVLCFFAFQCFAHYQEQRKYKIYAWYLGVVMLLIQYGILVAVNQRINFSINGQLWIIFIGFIAIGSSLLYLWYNYLQHWKFKQYMKKQRKLELKLKNKQKEKYAQS